MSPAHTELRAKETRPGLMLYPERDLLECSGKKKKIIFHMKSSLMCLLKNLNNNMYIFNFIS